MLWRPPQSPQISSSAASDVYNGQQERVDFADAGGRPDNFQTIFSEKIDAVDNTVKDASLGVKAAENVYADANRTAAERILDSSIFDTRRFRGDTRREIDPQVFYRSVVFGLFLILI